MRIKVVGVGGAGCNAVHQLCRESFEGVSLAVIGTDHRKLAESPLGAPVILGSKTLRGLGAGGDPERGGAAAEEDAARIRALCENTDMVFVVAGLGGGTGTGAAPVVARVAKEAGALVLAIVLLPFECEGSRRQSQALVGLQELKRAADGVICLPNQQVLKMIDEKTSLLEALEIANGFVAQGVRGIWRMLSRLGLINVDFADLCAVTQGRHSESSLATAEARGENRAREVVERLLAHPMIDSGRALAEASEILVSIASGTDLTMAEVNRIMDHISRQAELAHIIMGATVEEELGNRLLVTLVASRQPTDASESPAARARPAGTESLSEWAGSWPDATAGVRSEGTHPHPPSVRKPESLPPTGAGRGGARAGQRRQGCRMLQGQLPLEIMSRGRFEKSEPTLHQGEDLDFPTYIRRGVALN